MNFIKRLISSLFSNDKLNPKLEEHVIQVLEKKLSPTEDTLSDIIEHYRSIIKILSPQYSSVNLDPEDMTVIIIDDIEYMLDDASSWKLRKASNHRMAIEFLLPSDYNSQKQMIYQIEKILNDNPN